MINIQSDQLDEYYSYIYRGEKMTYENGWELLLLNLGRYPNGESNSIFQDHPDVPYIILYNRYSATLRIFANYGPGKILSPGGITYDAMRIELSFDGIGAEEKVNAILRLNDKYDVSLDQPTKIRNAQCATRHPNQANNWFSADFQIAFDPCVCYHSSNLRLKFFAVENIDFSLQGRELSVEQDLITGRNINFKEYMHNFNINSADEANGGLILYRTLENMIIKFNFTPIKRTWLQ